MKQKTIAVRLLGLRPLMTDRYAGDNKTQLPVKEKLYLSPEGQLMLPALNIYSLLTAENTKSVTKMVMGKSWATVAMGIKSFTNINPHDIPILKANNEPITLDDWGTIITVHNTVARLAKGIPNPKERPVIALPWSIEFNMIYEENKECSLENLKMLFDRGGNFGLGTFRPFFGRYALDRFEVTQ